MYSRERTRDFTFERRERVSLANRENIKEVGAALI